MGSLAMWSGLAGAGKGLAEYAKVRAEEESYAKKSSIDEAREMRLQEIKAADARSNEELRFQYGVATEMLRGNLGMMEQEAQDAAAMERTRVSADAQTQTAAIGQAGQSARFAGEREARRTGEWFDPNAGRSGATDKIYEAIIGKYQPKTLTVSEANKLKPDNPWFNIEKDTPAIWDGTTWYLQKGDKYMLPDAPPKDIPPEKKDEAIQELWADPIKMGPEFLDAYKYLPLGFFQRYQQAELAAAGLDSFGRPLKKPE